jgi:hydroxymethylglutaryl-CoA lyase
MTVRAEGLPARVTIYEVGPRDGLQNEAGLVPTEVKAELIARLLAAGLLIVEATSFVHPRWVPQLADAEDLMRMLGDSLGDRARELPVLVPNERGLDRALELGCRYVAIFGSATETFAQKNLNRSLDEQFAMFEPVGRATRDSTYGPTSRCVSETRGRAPSRSSRSCRSGSGSSTSGRRS